MANPSVSYTFTNGTTSNANQVNQNFTDLINALIDGTKSLNIDAITAAGAITGNSTLHVLGNTALDGLLEVTGGATLKSTLDVTGATTLKSTLAVTGVTTLNGNLLPNVTDTHDIGITGTRWRHLFLAGNADMSGSLTVGSTANSYTFGSNSVMTNGSVAAKLFYYSGNATAGQGGNYNFMSDDGVMRYSLGLLGSAGAKDLTLYDIDNSAARLTVNYSTGAVTIPGTIYGTGKIAVGSISKDLTTYGTAPMVSNGGYTALGFSGGNFTGWGAQGTEASPSASQATNLLAGFGARGYGATGWASASKALIAMSAAENWTDSAQGTYITFNTTLIGGTTRAEKARITDAGTFQPGADASYDLGAAATRWKDIYLSGSIKMATVYPPGSAGSSERIERVKVTGSASAPSVTAQSGSFIVSAITRNGAGDYTIPITGFSDAPTAVVTGWQMNSVANTRIYQAQATTTTVRVSQCSVSGVAVDENFQMILMGPRA